MKIIINTDGGSRNNPGPSAVGVVVSSEKGVLKKYGQAIGEGTNNEAEYKAVIFALKKAKLLFGKSKAKEMEIEIRMDSELVVKQLNHQYKLKQEHIQELFIQVWNLMMEFKSVDFKYISRERNKEADRLVNEALDQEKEMKLF